MSNLKIINERPAGIPFREYQNRRKNSNNHIKEYLNSGMSNPESKEVYNRQGLRKA